MIEDYYCNNCDSWHNVDALESKSEQLDATVIDSRISYSVCPNCGSDDLQEINADLVVEFLNELKPVSRKLEVRKDIVREWIETA